ncbi:MAG TPA: LuxR family transcriptional regulator [Euzebyales bacterium]|nr:LuxR family transcriptional regulator [Euzebyales bacterium]
MREGQSSRHHDRGMLYGRETERGVIGELLREAAEFRGGALVLVGRPGAGKTALLQDTARAADALVLRAQGVESESELPFAALHQLLRPLADHVDRLPEPQADALRSALGRQRRGVGTPDRFLVSVATLGVLSAAGEDRLVLCLVDDAQWLDGASASALTFVARRLDVERVALLFGVRQGEAAGFDGGGLPVLPVAGLDHGSGGALLSDRAGMPFSPDVVARLVDETAGNALALAELPSMLTPAQLSGRQPLPSPLHLPGGVEGAFLQRVHRLPVATQTLLLVAATDTTRRVTTVLQAAATLGVPAASLDVAESAELVEVRGEQLDFRHPLVRSAVYQGATTRERRQSHQALASVLDGDVEVERRAWHRAAAAFGPDEGVVADLEAAAARATARGGYEAAWAALERAADLTVERERRAQLLTGAADNAWRGGQLRYAETLANNARSLASDPLLRAVSDRLRAWIQMTVGSPLAARQILVQASRDISRTDPELATELIGEATETAWVVQDHTAGAHVDDITADLSPSNEPRIRFYHHLIAGFRGLLQDDLEPAMQALRHVITIAREIDDTQLLVRAGHCAFHVGDDAAAYDLNVRVVVRARSAGAVGVLLPALERLAHAQVLTSRWTAAVASASEAARLARETGQRQLAALPVAWLALVAARHGDYDAFEAALAEAEVLAATESLGVYQGMLRAVASWARGVQLADSGHPASALGWLQEIDHPVVTRMAALDRIEVALHADRKDLADAWLTSFERFAEHTAAPWAEARVAHCRALLGDDIDAAQHFDTALMHHQRSQRSFERARTELAYGRFLRRARRRVLARTHLRAALDVFEALGAEPWTDRARVELRASGQTARKREPSTAAALTPQELQVARFVAQGLATKEVAAQLFLSPRTIEFHLRNVFTKLQISSRIELAHLPLE